MISNGRKTASGVESSFPCGFKGIIVKTDGTNDATVNVHDGLSAAGLIKYEIKVTGADNYGGIMFNDALNIDVGVYVALSGTGASYIAYLED